jgi:membrane fusion protein (multidrug efflux system)
MPVVETAATPTPPPEPAPAAAHTPPTAAHAPSAPPHPVRRTRRIITWIAVLVILAIILVVGLPTFLASLHTVSTDDAYVNGHVTFVAARVAGQVAHVLVDDNNRVHKGDLLVQLDREPLQVQVAIAQATVTAAQSDLTAAIAQTRAAEGQTRSARFNLQRSIEDVDNQIALLRSKVATLNSQQATLAKAQADYVRGQNLIGSGALTEEELDQRKEALLVAQAKIEAARQDVYQVRVSLGLPPKPDNSDDLTQVPADLDQTFSSVRQAQATLMQDAAQLGVSDSFETTPKELIANFLKRDPTGDINKIYDQLLKDAPAVKQAEAKLTQAQANLLQAQLNLRYCDVRAEIDGVVTRRDVNPGNNVVAGQSLMAIRSLTDIWIDANFKETQLANIRLGQPVDIEVDMYGRHQHFNGRVSGFTMGTGSTLALLPAENATGNFVKVVQRLPVRIDLIDYDPDKLPLFVGLSVTPIVHLDAQPIGPDAGKVLQPYLPASTQPSAVPETLP